MTPGKSGRNCSLSSRGPLSNARAGDSNLVEVRSELHNFQNIVKGELEIMKAIVKQLLYEVQKRNTGDRILPTLSEVETTGLENAMARELAPIP